MMQFIQTNEEGRIVATMSADTPYSTNGFFLFDVPEDLEHSINEYVLERGELIYSESPAHKTDRENAEKVAARDSFIEGAPEQIGTVEDGLMEVAEISSTNETDIEDLTNAIMELAAMIGGNENG